MQFSAPDGSKHSSQLGAYQASQKPAPSDSQSDQPKSIESDPKAMQAIDYLKSAGYSAEEVEQCMQDSDQSQPQSSAPATQAAPLQIPGMS